MKKVMIIITALSLLTACTNEADTVRALQNSGYTDIKPGGYAWLSCGKDDFYHTEFTAVNPAGKQVKGVVCSGLFKDATVRF